MLVRERARRTIAGAVHDIGVLLEAPYGVGVHADVELC